MLNNLRERVTQVLCHVELQIGDQDELLFSHGQQEIFEGRKDPAFAQDDNEGRAVPRLPTIGRKASAHVNPNDQSTWGRISRNAECPCKSGKKYKHCHGTV
jgi:preprotein translocase subunit SecA